jgi:hypothetical protein
MLCVLSLQASLPILHEFNAIEYVRFLDGLQRMQVQPGPEWTGEFFRSSGNKIVNTANRVRLVWWAEGWFV